MKCSIFFANDTPIVIPNNIFVFYFFIMIFLGLCLIKLVQLTLKSIISIKQAYEIRIKLSEYLVN